MPKIHNHHMRLAKIIVVLAALGALIHVLHSAVASDTSKTPISVVPESPVAAKCTYLAGKTIVRIAAVEDVSNLRVILPDGKELAILPEIQAGWSVAQTFTGTYQSVTVSFVWRGADKQVPVPCQ
ncbi:MAG: hypothetical protein PWP76_200 [Candidatus Diapherotrites archaeon]|nr:hypothetical protein [Candidatus Diapherotrites archaeon]MDN5366861.1 hypothetical protein [Candidatus Diapherotrites archaeon]